MLASTSTPGLQNIMLLGDPTNLSSPHITSTLSHELPEETETRTTSRPRHERPNRPMTSPNPLRNSTGGTKGQPRTPSPRTNGTTTNPPRTVERRSETMSGLKTQIGGAKGLSKPPSPRTTGTADNQRQATRSLVGRTNATPERAQQDRERSQAWSPSPRKRISWALPDTTGIEPTRNWDTSPGNESICQHDVALERTEARVTTKDRMDKSIIGEFLATPPLVDFGKQRICRATCSTSSPAN
jgi:hypothetical protein